MGVEELGVPGDAIVELGGASHVGVGEDVLAHDAAESRTPFMLATAEMADFSKPGTYFLRKAANHCTWRCWSTIWRVRSSTSSLRQK